MRYLRREDGLREMAIRENTNIPRLARDRVEEAEVSWGGDKGGCDGLELAVVSDEDQPDYAG